MKKLLYTFLAVSIIFSSCEEDESPTNNGNNVTELEGAWVGYEVGGISGDWTFIFSENEMDITASPLNPVEWYLGNYSIDTLASPKQIDFVITNCMLSSYIGTTAKGIYKIENDTTLTFSGCQPGNPDRPSSFLDTSVQARSYILTKQQINNEKRCLEEIKKFGDEKKYIYEVKNIEKQKAGYGRLAQVSITVLFKHSEGGTIITEEDKKREKEEIKGRIKELQEYLEMGVITQEEYNSEIEKIRKKILSE